MGNLGFEVDGRRNFLPAVVCSVACYDTISNASLLIFLCYHRPKYEASLYLLTLLVNLVVGATCARMFFFHELRSLDFRAWALGRSGQLSFLLFISAMNLPALQLVCARLHRVPLSQAIGVIMLVCATLAYAVGASLAANLWYVVAAVNGRQIFQDSMHSVLCAPLGWFDETPSGRITSRFSGDLNGLDTVFSQFAEALMQFVFLEMAVIITPIVLNPYFAVIATVYILFVIIVFKQLAALNRDSKRYSNLALSPVLTNITEMRVC